MSTFGQMNFAFSVQPEINLQAVPKTALADNHAREEKQGHSFFLMLCSSLHEMLQVPAERLTFLWMDATVLLEQQQGPVKEDSLFSVVF